MLFGTEAPKIIVGLDESGSQTEVALDYFVILKDEPELETFGVKAVRTGKKKFTNAGKHWIFQGRLHLWKYADPEAKYLEFKSYEGTEIILCRFSDGEPIYDTYGNAGHFILTAVNESYTDDVNKFDVLTLTFRSIHFISTTAPTVTIGYRYYMNLITDTPRGSLGSDTSWNNYYEIGGFNESDVPASTRQFNVVGVDPINEYDLVNGYKAMHMHSGAPYNSPIYLNALDSNMLADITDLTFIIAFKKAVAINSLSFLFDHYTTGDANRFSLYIPATGADITARMADGAATVDATITGCNLDDNNWHIAVVKYNQTSGAVTIYLEDGQTATASGAFTARAMNSDKATSPRMLNAHTAAYVFGTNEADLLGDFMFFSEVLTTAQINHECNFIANRLGISWTNLI